MTTRETDKRCDGEKASQTADAAKPNASRDDTHSDSEKKPETTDKAKEYGGRDGPGPTRFGDWEKAGRCIDF